MSDAVRQEKPARKRYTTQACEGCRRRRSKCDGRKPSCSRCLGRGLLCQYSAEEDGRQPAPKSYVVLLRNRIDALERLLQFHGINADASFGQLMAKGYSSLSQSRPNGVDPVAKGKAPVSGSRIFDGAFTLDTSLDFDQDREIRYFGPTSGRLHFEASLGDMGDDGASLHKSAAAERHSSTKSRDYFNNFYRTIAEEDDVSNGLKSHLLELYFTWEQPWYQVVDERLFRESMECNGRYFSRLLLNCILAAGSRYSDRLEIRLDPRDPIATGKVFLEKAEILLHYELKRPNITTIQSLAIMSIVYIGMGEDAAGLLHFGMANRLALDMGLNMDPGCLTETISMPMVEVELRRKIYWALYCHDKLAASYTGRVCTLLDSQGAVNMLSPESENQRSPGSEQSHDRCSQTSQLLNALVGVCQILEKILVSLWAPKPLVRGAERTEFFRSCLLELKSWFYDIPSNLRIDQPNELPQAYTLQMVYHTSYILLAKAFLRKRHLEESSPSKVLGVSEKTEDDITTLARSTCYESARAICVVARKYRQVYGSFRRSPITATHCILSAALVFLEDDSQQVGTKPNSRSTGIELCLKVLEELSQSWSPARHIRENLGRLYRKSRNMDVGPFETQSFFYDSLEKPSPQDGQILSSGPDDGDNGLNTADATFPLTYDTSWTENEVFDDIQQYTEAGQIESQSNDFNEGFENILHLPFSSGSLPSDYDMFDSLIQMY